MSEKIILQSIKKHGAILESLDRDIILLVSKKIIEAIKNQLEKYLEISNSQV